MYTHVLHATDLNADHYGMCQQAQAIAQCFGAQFYLLHVIEPPPSLQLAQGLGFAEFDRPIKVQEDAQAVMATLGEALNIPIDHQFVEIGPIKIHVMNKAQQLGCGLIIIGRHTRTKLPAFLGSTAQGIVHEATCDVLTLATLNNE